MIWNRIFLEKVKFLLNKVFYRMLSFRSLFPMVYSDMAIIVVFAQIIVSIKNLEKKLFNIIFACRF